MSDLPPTRDPACATRPRDGPERRVVAVPPDGLDEIEAAVMASEAPAVILVDRPSMRLLLRYVRAQQQLIADLERERDEAGSG
jgi:hypothetical protein